MDCLKELFWHFSCQPSEWSRHAICSLQWTDAAYWQATGTHGQATRMPNEHADKYWQTGTESCTTTEKDRKLPIEWVWTWCRISKNVKVLFSSMNLDKNKILTWRFSDFLGKEKHIFGTKELNLTSYLSSSKLLHADVPLYLQFILVLLELLGFLLLIFIIQSCSQADHQTDLWSQGQKLI